MTKAADKFIEEFRTAIEEMAPEDLCDVHEKLRALVARERAAMETAIVDSALAVFSDPSKTPN